MKSAFHGLLVVLAIASTCHILHAQTNVGLKVQLYVGLTVTGEVDATNPESTPETPPFVDVEVGLPPVRDCAVAWGDYDNDGRLDVLLAGDTGTGYVTDVWRSTEAGFTRIDAGLPGIKHAAVAWGDFDQDGRLDILLAGETSPDPGYNPSYVTQLWRNTGTGFTNIDAGLSRVAWGSVAWGDYDNDGRPDILLTGATDATSLPDRRISQVWRNTGTGFTNINAGLPNFSGQGAWGDYDGDGRLDALLVGGDQYGIAPAQVWRNTGDGFTNAQAELPLAMSGAWGDYDNDGRLDLLLAGSPGVGFAQVWRNTGNGFTNINAGLGNVSAGSAAWGDCDNDGRLDALITGYTMEQGSSAAVRQPAQVWHNTPTGFVKLEIDFPRISSDSVAWGDYDNDGRLDLLLAGYTGSGQMVAQVWRNQSAISNQPPTCPTGLVAEVRDLGVRLQWEASTDAETPPAGLAYNLRVGTAPGASDIISPQALSDGFRLVSAMGNAQHRLFALLTNLLPGTYYWTVQSLDTAFAGSSFAQEQVFTIGSYILECTRPTPDTFEMRGYGEPGAAYTLETSTNLLDWTDLTLLTAGPDGSIVYSTDGVTQREREFFRLAK